MQFLQSKLHVFLIAVGSVVWSLTMVKSGWVYAFGMGFWGPNGHDGVWHLALINSLARSSFEMPVFSGAPLQNYHIGFDLFLALLHKVTLIPAHILYFQVIPPLIALGVGVLTYRLVYLWQKSKAAAFWSTFFVYFGGSFGPIVALVRSGEFGGESMFWAQQAISTLLNPPFALSIVLLLVVCLLLLEYRRKPETKTFILLVLITGVMVEIKVYGGILTLSGLLAAGLLQLVKERRFEFLKVFFGSLVLSFLLFIPLNSRSTSLVVWQPFWFLENMMALSDRVGWPRFHEAMVNYRLGNVWHKAIPAYTVAFLIFLVGNLGTRVIKELLVLKWIRNTKKVGVIEIFLSTVILGGVVLPLLFLQKGTPWNTIQFLYYSLVFSGILAGVAFSRLLEEKSLRFKVVAVATLLTLTLPTTYATLKHYLPSRPPAKLSGAELEALEFLRRQEDGIVLTYPFDKYLADTLIPYPPRPLFAYESTAYVAAFSAKPVYVEDEVNLNITGYDWKARRKMVEEFLETLDQDKARKFLRDSSIKYIYWVQRQDCRPVCRVPEQRAKLGEAQLGLTQIFENSQVKIYRVD